jgi:GT2 family glycosyltransferase
MNQKIRPVIAVICHYNMVSSITILLDEVLKQGYDSIYVLDDASTDHSAESLPKLYPKVKFIIGHQNLGPAGNRNRILLAGDKIPEEALLHFLDADVSLTSHNTPKTIRSLFKDKDEKLIGGLITIGPENRQYFFNYGPAYSIYQAVGANLIRRLDRLIGQDKAKASRFYERYSYFLSAWPNLLNGPEVRETFWVAEANFIVAYGLFKRLAGFDARLSYHEIQDLALRLRNLEIPRFATSRVSVNHPDIKLTRKRWLKQRKAELRLLARYGLPLK